MEMMQSAKSTNSQAKEASGRTIETIEVNGREEVTRTLARRACDACRARRRKCYFANGPLKEAPGAVLDHTRAQCFDCKRLAIPCSFLVPTRIRGPKPKRRHVQGDNSCPRQSEEENARERSKYAYSNSDSQQLKLPGSYAGFDSPSAIEQHAFPEATSLGLPTDELCSRNILNIIMKDYLDRIYPLVPVVHRPTFRAQLASHHDIKDSEFFALIMALAALTVGLLPSRFPYYQSMAPEVGSRFNTRTAMINFCVETCMRLRTATYWDKVSQRKWAVCYLLSVGCFQTGQTNRSRMLEVEAMQVGRLLGIHRISDYEGLNCIETQLRKKAFWLMFYTTAHAWHQCCGREERLSFFDSWRLHELNFEALIPIEVDDEQIFEHEIRRNPSIPSPTCATLPDDQGKEVLFNLTIGFNIHSMVFFKSTRIALTPGNSDWEQRVPPETRLAELRQLLDDVRYMLDDAPGPMRQWASWSNAPSPTKDLSLASNHDGWEGSDNTFGTGDDNAGALSAQIQVMRANLHGTHMWIQSVLMDRIDLILQEQVQRPGDTSSNGSPMASLKASWLEREDLCRQTLHLLHSLAYTHQEPNGLYFAYKIRDIGVALLNCPFDEQHPSSRRATGYIQEFARALSRLDRSEMLNISSLRSWVDTDREKPSG